MRRREFISLIGGMAAWPVAAHGEQAGMPVVGWLGSQSQPSEGFRTAPFREGLKEAGFIERQNVAIEYRWADGQYDRLPALAANLVDRRVAVIAVAGIAEALAAKGASTTIPIVFLIGGDPVRFGLVASLNRPRGMGDLAERRGRAEAVRAAARSGADGDQYGAARQPGQRHPIGVGDERGADRRPSAGVELHVLHAGTERDLDMVFATVLQLHAGALVISPESLFALQSERLGGLALRHAVPAIAAGGGLMSYGTNITGLYRQVGMITGRVLKGEKPADLPIQQAVKLEFVVNKTAKSLGLDVPRTLIARADEVIE